MPKKLGRPALAKKDALGTVFSVRLRQDEAKNVNQAIAASGLRRPEWLRATLMRAAAGSVH